LPFRQTKAPSNLATVQIHSAIRRKAVCKGDGAPYVGSFDGEHLATSGKALLRWVYKDPVPAVEIAANARAYKLHLATGFEASI